MANQEYFGSEQSPLRKGILHLYLRFNICELKKRSLKLFSDMLPCEWQIHTLSLLLFDLCPHQ